MHHFTRNITLLSQCNFSITTRNWEKRGLFLRIFRDFRDSGSGRRKINTSSVNGFKSCENSSFLRKTVNPRAGRGGKILRSRNLTVFIFCQILAPARNFQARFRCWQNRLFFGPQQHRGEDPEGGILIGEIELSKTGQISRAKNSDNTGLVQGEQKVEKTAIWQWIWSRNASFFGTILTPWDRQKISGGS